MSAMTVFHASSAPAIPAADAERVRGYANAEKAAADLLRASDLKDNAYTML